MSSNYRIDAVKIQGRVIRAILLKAQPYPHRPYSERTIDKLLLGFLRWEESRALCDWEIEGAYADMAKSQKRSNREIRKLKATKAKPVVGLAEVQSSPVSALMQRPKKKD